MKNKKATGAALITVLIIVFMVMAIIANLTIRNYRVIKRLTNQKIMEQSYAILMTAIDFGRAGLATSGATSQIDTLTDLWAQPLPKTTVLDNIQMSGYIIDEQGKFNINDLVNNGVVNQNIVQQFANLLSSLNIPTSLASSIALYMASPQNQSAIMSQYTNANPGYRPAGRPILDLSELLLVKGMTPTWLYKLDQYVTAIPKPINYSIYQQSTESSTTNTTPNNASGTSINVNTASAEVIAAKSGLSLPVAERMTTIRTVTPFKSQQDINGFLASNGIIATQNDNSINMADLATQSSYFTIHAIIDSGPYEFKWAAMVYRATRGGPWPQILWQHPE